MKHKNAGFTLIELLVVISLMITISVFSYGPVMDSVENARFKAVVADAQSKVNQCYWTYRSVNSCNLFQDATLSQWFDDYGALTSLGSIGVPGDDSDDIPQYTLELPAGNDDRTFLGVAIIPNATATGYEMKVTPRSKSLMPMMYTLTSKVNATSIFN